MILVGTASGVLGAEDRALWMTPPFDDTARAIGDDEIRLRLTVDDVRRLKTSSNAAELRKRISNRSSDVRYGRPRNTEEMP